MNNIFYDYQKILSYNALLNFLIGERGVGKTYGISKFSVKQFLKKGEQFSYIRRYKSELNEAKTQFFSEISKNNEFPKNKLYNKGYSFYCDDKLCGFGMTLSTAQNLKSKNFSNVKNIIFDEFIPEGGKHYLPNEVHIFLNLIETISRLRDIRVFLLGNAVSLINPYFLYFDLKIPENSDISTFKNGLILVQHMKNENYRKVKNETRFGQLVAGTPYSQYAIENKFIDDDKNFIEHKTKNSKFQFAITYKNKIFGVWFAMNDGKIFISNDYIKNTPFLFCLTQEDHTPNTLLIKSLKKYNCWKIVQENYQLGNVFFETQKIKLLFQDILKMMLI